MNDIGGCDVTEAGKKSHFYSIESSLHPHKQPDEIKKNLVHVKGYNDLQSSQTGSIWDKDIFRYVIDS